MNGKKSKMIRNEARKLSAKNPTQYKVRWFEKLIGKTDKEGKQIKEKRGTIFCIGYRRVYQDMKREYLRSK